MQQSKSSDVPKIKTMFVGTLDNMAKQVVDPDREKQGIEDKILISNKYKVVKKLGKGSFGILYQGINIRTNEEVAIKLESI